LSSLSAAALIRSCLTGPPVLSAAHSQLIGIDLAAHHEDHAQAGARQHHTLDRFGFERIRPQLEGEGALPFRLGRCGGTIEDIVRLDPLGEAVEQPGEVFSSAKLPPSCIRWLAPVRGR